MLASVDKEVPLLTGVDSGDGAFNDDGWQTVQTSQCIDNLLHS